MTLLEFRHKLYTIKVDILYSTTRFRGVATSRHYWEEIYPEIIDYIVYFNLPSINTACCLIDGMQIFLVDEPDIFCALIELPNLTQDNALNQQTKVE